MQRLSCPALQMNIKHRVCAECGIARASRGATDRGDPHEARALDGTIASSAFCLFDLLAGVRINAEVPARARAIHEERERQEHHYDDAGLEGHLLA